jgi:hypothetical protein
LNVSSSSSAIAIFVLFDPAPSSLPVSLTGTGVDVDYSYFTPAHKAILESKNGVVLSVNNANSNGSGFEDVSVSVIPEPSSTLLVGLGAICVVARRKRSA